MTKGRKMTARIPVSPEVHEMYKDMTQASGLTFDELLLYFAEQEGAAINQREQNFAWGLRMKDKLTAWAKKQKGKNQ